MKKEYTTKEVAELRGCTPRNIKAILKTESRRLKQFPNAYKKLVKHTITRTDWVIPKCDIEHLIKP